jgi:FkbM family methyltransferase
MTSQRLRSLIPAPIKSVLRELSYLSIFSDIGSLIRYYRVNHPSHRRGAAASTAELRIRPLGHRAITIRTKGTDARVVFDTFIHRFHLPPRKAVPQNASLILDLGSNIGCTMAHLAHVYPTASIVGVELDSANASLCRKNVSSWGDRCQIVEGAIWSEDGHVQYERLEGNEDAFAATSGSVRNPGASRTAPALSINTLLSGLGGQQQQIDYIKMDIEGAERDVLRLNTAWAARVKCIKVELHGDYTPQECIADLEALGFQARADTAHAVCVIGVSGAQVTDD